jgi:hypothetical protein
MSDFDFYLREVWQRVRKQVISIGDQAVKDMVYSINFRDRNGYMPRAFRNSTALQHAQSYIMTRIKEDGDLQRLVSHVRFDCDTNGVYNDRIIVQFSNDTVPDTVRELSERINGSCPDATCIKTSVNDFHVILTYLDLMRKNTGRALRLVGHEDEDYCAIVWD